LRAYALHIDLRVDALHVGLRAVALHIQLRAYAVTPRFPNNVNNTNNQSIQRKTECHTTFKT